MPNHPLLILPRPTDAPRSTRGGGGATISRPLAGQQRQRLDARFQQIADSFQGLQSTVQGLEPEQVLVLETIAQSVDGLAEAAAKIPGMEWLAEIDLGDVPPADGFVDQSNPNRPLGCRLYAVLTNQQAMDQLLTLWRQWCQAPNERARRGFGAFKNLFIWLREVRRWDVQDRIAATGLLDYFQERLEFGTGEIQFEVELWCRAQASRRAQAYEELATLIGQSDGHCLTQSAIPEIRYHGVLATLPAARVRETVVAILSRGYSHLLRCEAAMFFRPFGQALARIGNGEAPPAGLRQRLEAKPAAVGNPIVALFDGMPFERHVALRGRLVIDDPDDHAARYKPHEQQHGTAMASLILQGDLNRDEEPLANPVYARPIFLPVTDFRGQTHEGTPDNLLLVDLIHRAVKRLFEGEPGSPPTAPTVKVINLSFGNRHQPFDRELSPLARLLDWLAWKYKILFLVSVGNYADAITVSVSSAEWRQSDGTKKRDLTLHAMRDTQLERRPLSPAEALNAVTVGAVHADESAVVAIDRRHDLLSAARLPSPVSTVSNGFRRSIKPEILFPGGRQFYLERLAQLDDPAGFDVSEAISPPGQLIAGPGQRPLELDRTLHSRGTSNATALASRCAARIHENLLALANEPGGESLAEADTAVVLKCLLAHGARWGAAAILLDGVFRDAVVAANGNDLQRATIEMRRLKARFLGYGEVDPERCTVCNDERVTLLGASRLIAESAHVFEIPLPPTLSGVRVQRLLTVTLAWFTPFNPQHQAYRQARMWFDVKNEVLKANTLELDANQARRGTVEHRVFEGERAVVIGERDSLTVQVNCAADAGGFEASIPYALAVTLEVARPLGVSIYDQIRDRIRPRVEITPQPSR